MQVDVDKIRREFGKYNLRYWDFRIEESETKNISAWNNEIKRNSFSSSVGFCSRVLFENGWGFACSSDFNQISKIIEKSVKLAKLSNKNEKIEFNIPERKNDSKETKQKLNFKDVDDEQKIKLSKELAESALKFDKKIKSARIWYIENILKKKFLSSDCFIEQKLARGKIFAQINSKSNESEEEKRGIIGHSGGYEFTENAKENILDACKRAVEFLKAKKGKGGESSVIIDGQLSGLLVHEALGHASEADLVLQNSSCLNGKIGERLSENCVNVCDDATENDFTGWGCYYYDDEGIRAKKNYIIKNGILNSYLHNIESSSQLKMNLTGNSRAESAFRKPIIRMTNTYIEKGDKKFDDMIKEIKKGYLMAKSSGGQVDTVTGNFQFSANDVYEIKNGDIGQPLKSMSFGGNLLEILKNILMVENKYDCDFPGTCIKGGQHVPVGGFCPRVYLKKAVVN
ncbi:MAG: TldD/PmbA family protein [Nanoarchaeota archaeon]